MRTTIPGLIVIFRCLTLVKICWDERQKQFDLRSKGISTFVQFLMPLIFVWCLCLIFLGWRMELIHYSSVTNKYFLESVRWIDPIFLIFQYLLVFSMQQSLTSSLMRVLEISQDFGLSEVPSWMMLAWLASIGCIVLRFSYVHAILISNQNFNLLAKDIVYVLFKVSSCFVKIFYLAVARRTMDIMAVSRQQMEAALRSSSSDTKHQSETIFHYLSIQNEMILICELDLSRVFGVLLCMYMIQDILEATMFSYFAWCDFDVHFPVPFHLICLACCCVYASIPLVYDDPGEEVSKVDCQ